MSKTIDKGHIEAVSFRYKWVLDDSCLECCKKIGDSVESPIFTINTSGKTLKWRLKIYPKGKAVGFRNTPLFLISYNKDPTEIHYLLSLFSKSKQRVILDFQKKSRQIFETYGNGYGVCHIYENDFQVDEKSGRFIDSDWTILCDITVDNFIAIAEKHGMNSENRTLKELEYLKDLLDNKKFSDVRLKVNDQIFHAHKCILTSRSPVFEAMFTHEMQEKRDNVIDIKDIDPEVFEEMLRFIYTGKVGNIKNYAYSLLPVADRYLMQGLKNLCEESIINGLTLKNAVNYLKYANDCNAEELKKKVIDFIALNIEKMLDTPEYKSMENMPGSLVLEVLKAVSLKNIKNS